MTHRSLPDGLPLQHDDTDTAALRTRIIDNSINATARTVDVVFTTGASVRRRRWAGWDTAIPFDEVLVVSRNAIDMSRLERGAPALDSHSMYSSYSQVGVVERAWLEGSEGLATIRFPKEGIDKAADRMFGLVSDRIMRNVSVGYSIDRARVVEAEKKGEIEKRFVERWTPYEISFVTIGADAGAQVRSLEQAARYPVSIDARAATSAALARMRMRARLSA
jgi:hypothetical protein